MCHDARGEPTARCPPLLLAFHSYLAESLDFWAQLPLAELGRWTSTRGTGPLATWFREGEYISPHDDQVGLRALSFVLSLTKQWERQWGGAFWWLGGGGAACLPPEFNSLLLFQPSPLSLHLVSPVSFRQPAGAHPDYSDLLAGERNAPDEGGAPPPWPRKRLAVSGWFEARDKLHPKLVAHHAGALRPAEPVLRVDGRPRRAPPDSALSMNRHARRAERSLRTS